MQHLEDERLSLDLSEIQSHSTSSLENVELASLQDDEEDKNIEGLLNVILPNDFGSFTLERINQSATKSQPSVLPVTSPPPLLCRHPPPASGRDGDILVLKKVLDDILIKTDVNIAKNLLKLIDTTEKYKVFTPEFPILHLRKSKITNLISAYKATGLLHNLRYMKDEEYAKDWTKLLTIVKIETATRNIWRLSVALHLSFFVCFLSTFSKEDSRSLMKLLDESQTEIQPQWGEHFDITHGHCDNIVAIAVSERIGEEKGYNLLLANVKSSLPFSFLNNASRYAGFCIRLILAHYSASPFLQKLKHSLYSAPHNDSPIIFELDTSREIDHRTVKKCIRPTSTISLVLPKMSTVDEKRQTHIMRMSLLTGRDEDDGVATQDIKSAKSCASKYLQKKKLSANDIKHFIQTTTLILKMNAPSTEGQKIPKNIYPPSKPDISETLLDKSTYQIGHYLIKRYLCTNGILGLNEEVGTHQIRTEEATEDCTKSTTNKSLGVKKALTSILNICLTELTTNPSTSEEIVPLINDLLMFDFRCVPNLISSNTKVAIVEFVGAKFRTFATTGESYIKYVTGELDIQADIIIDVDREAVYGQCECEDSDKCTYPLFTTPVRAVFTQGNGLQHSENLTMIKQRKGEAELSQAD
ncbi:unnamed protein product [Mytilus coruscus]|uniref:Uncharacterized protein n=1 Tax=Mytilus coruscus TaxID=42192 RepID=A0A6J8A2E4_MYTCO|nr:unnamed protein product [Mytilus coruscus]